MNAWVAGWCVWGNGSATLQRLRQTAHALASSLFTLLCPVDPNPFAHTHIHTHTLAQAHSHVQTHTHNLSLTHTHTPAGSGQRVYLWDYASVTSRAPHAQAPVCELTSSRAKISSLAFSRHQRPLMAAGWVMPVRTCAHCFKKPAQLMKCKNTTPHSAEGNKAPVWLLHHHHARPFDACAVLGHKVPLFC